MINRYILILGNILLMNTASYALPFNIVPAATLPTEVFQGQTVKAYYTVTNQTGSTRSQNYVKYLPPNVTQIASDPSIPNLCSASFTLAPHSQPGDSCTLELSISGEVNGSDPNPHHHLFVCFPKGITCAGTNYPLNVKVSVVVNPPGKPQAFLWLADGSYTDANFNSLPLLYTSDIQGTSWALINNLTFPNGFTQGQFLASGCTTTGCIAAGDYFTASSEGLMFAISSTPSDWHVVDAGLPPNVTNSLFNSTMACGSQTCISAGSGEDSNSNTLPILAVTNNDGATWSYPSLVLPSNFDQFGEFTASACHGSVCNVAGSYFNGSITSTFFYISTDNGATWKMPSVTLPIDFAQLDFIFSMTCMGNTCIAIGGYESSILNHEVPLILVSHDGGSNWSPGIYPPFDNSVTFAVLRGLACNTTMCVADGYLINPNPQPFVMVSHDLGNTWVSTILPTPGFADGGLSYAACTPTTCLALGDHRFTDLLTYITQDNGVTWSFIPIPIPAGYTDAAYLGITCLNNLCHSFGYKDSTTEQPLLLQSSNSGNTWSEISLNLPSNFTDDGVLNAASAS